MPRPRTLGLATLAVAVALLASARWTIRAQDHRAKGGASEPARPSAHSPGASSSLGETLDRPMDFPFGEPTTLKDLAASLRKALRAQVVIDRAALKRLDLDDEATVQLELLAVRPRVGLKLLLDQVGLTYRVEAEDNLLILTDDEGAEDPLERVYSELKTMHRDIHDLRDAIEEVYQAVAPEEEVGPAMRKPTIIEEVPGEPEPGPEERPSPKSKPGT